MNRYFRLAPLFILLFSCRNDQSGEKEKAENTAFTPYHWEATDTGSLAMKKTEGVGPDTLSPQGVVSFLNHKWTHVQLEYMKTSGDTLFITIPQPEYLTQRMGSSGSLAYLSEAVYNFTEIPGIHNVNFDFTEGDHAGPGTFNRDDFPRK